MRPRQNCPSGNCDGRPSNGGALRASPLWRALPTSRDARVLAPPNPKFASQIYRGSRGLCTTKAKEVTKKVTSFALVEQRGLEPRTPCLQSRCSSQLSYCPKMRQTYGFSHRNLRNKFAFALRANRFCSFPLKYNRYAITSYLGGAMWT